MIFPHNGATATVAPSRVFGLGVISYDDSFVARAHLSDSSTARGDLSPDNRDPARARLTGQPAGLGLHDFIHAVMFGNPMTRRNLF